MNSFVTRVQVLFLALLASVLSARGDIDALYTREELTDQMGAGWPEKAQVFHWYRTDSPSSDNQAWAIRFNLTDPHFRFTTRLGLDNTTAEGNARADLGEMAAALKEEGRNPLVAINGGIATTLADFNDSLMSDSRILRDVVKTRPDVFLTESSSHRFELRTGKSDRHGWPTDSKSQKVRNLAGWSRSLLRYEDGKYVDVEIGDKTLNNGYQHSLIGVNENAALGQRTLMFLVTRGDVADRDAVAMLVTLGSKTVVENEGGVSAGLWFDGTHSGLKIPETPTTKLASGLFMTYEDSVAETVNIHDPTAGTSVENDTYATLEEAMRAATKEESIILTAPVEVKASCAASAGGTLTTYSMAEPGTAVTIADGVKMSVGGMTFEHVAFRAPDGSRATVYVSAGRRLTVGLCVENLCVQTADKGGFCMSSNLTEEVFVDCLAATEENPIFGTYDTSLTEEELDASLPFVRHPTDPMKIATVSGSYLRWMTAAARVGEHVYGTLDDALAAARRAGERPTVEILCPIALEKSTAIDFDCTLTATNDDVMASAVLLKPGVTLSVGSDVRVLFADVAITNAAKSAVIGIEPNGIAAVSGHVVVDRFETRKDELDPSDVPPQGVFELAGELTVPVRLASVAGDTVGTVVGIASLPEGAAAAAAAKVVNANDDEQCAEAFPVEGEEGGVALRWRVADVSDDDAVVRLKQGGVTTNYRSLRTLFRALSGDAEIVILKDCALTEPLTIAAGTEVKLVSNGEDPAAVSLPSSSATAWVTVYGILTLENVVFDGSSLGPKEKSASAFRVEKNGQLTFGAQAGVQSVQLNSSSAGAVYVNKGGTLTMTDGSRISGITGGKLSSAAVYLVAGSVFNAQGGQIVDCTQPKGGVCVNGATMNVSGSLTVQGNANSSGAVKNVTVENSGKLVLADTLTGMVGVTLGNADGETFGTVTAGGDSADHFICDVKPDGKTLRGTAAEGSLVWKTVVVVPPAMVRINDDPTPYGTLQDAVDAAAAGDTLTILAPLAVSSMPVRIDKQLTVRAADPAFVVTRTSPDRTNVNTVQRAIEIAADVRFENIVLGDDVDPWARAFIHVLPGATLTLGDGAVVRNVRGTFLLREGTKEPIGRSAAGILAEGTLVMEPGSRIENCTNDFGESAGGGVLVSGERAFFDFRGGIVTGCSAHRGGGVFVEKQAGAAVSGAGQIIGNANGNLYMAAESPLAVTGAFTGRIDHMDGVVRPDTETNLFATVDYDYTGDLDALAAGAIRFTNELTRACGVAVTNGTGGASYLWNTALATRPDYEKGGESWAPIGEVPPQPVPVVTTEIDPPTAVEGLVYNGQEQKGVVPATGYSVTDGAKVNAGNYTAIVAPWPNYVWRDDGTADPREIHWSIAKATYDMRGVVFTNVTYACDGAAKSNLVDEATLPAGVRVTNYLNNGQTEVGTYTVTAQFGGDADNFEPIADMTATLTITEAPTPPPGPTPGKWEVVTNHPTLIAFKSIERVSDTEWTLVVTDRVEYCNYRLIWTKDLAKGFTETGKWEHAVGPAAESVWTTNVITTGGAWFWRAEGADGTNMVYKTEE